MKISLADYLRTVEPDLQDRLVSTPSLLKIQTLARSLPPLSLFGFELRLGNNKGTVDFQVGLPRLPFAFPEELLTNSTWQKIDNFCKCWTETGTFLNSTIERVGLEFDMDSSSEILIPCLFADFNWDKLDGGQNLAELLQYWPFRSKFLN